jgi:hypothetical protein
VRDRDSAGRQAREVVGLYGDPDTTWGICLELGLSTPLGAHEVARRLARLVPLHPHLGPAPELEVVAASEWDVRRETLAAAPYAVDGPLVRAALADDGRRLFVAAHHGACDGLGLVALADRMTGAGLVSGARGIGDMRAPRSFLRSSLTRLHEAIRHPPPRFSRHHDDASSGEQLRIATLPRLATGTVDLCVALGAVFRQWNGSASRGDDRPLFVMGASRRPPGNLVPDRQTAYLRLRLDPSWDRERVREAFVALSPEPEFPETSVGGIGPRVTRTLRGRLGATAQLSNLGVVEGAGLDYVAMFPALSGPRGVAVGMVSTADTTTLSLRTRGSEFGPTDTAELLAMTAERLLVQSAAQ